MSTYRNTVMDTERGKSVKVLSEVGLMDPVYTLSQTSHEKLEACVASPGSFRAEEERTQNKSLQNSKIREYRKQEGVAVISIQSVGVSGWAIFCRQIKEKKKKRNTIDSVPHSRPPAATSL